MSVAEKLTKIAQNMQAVYDAGKAAGGGDEEYYQGYLDGCDDEHSRFWDAFQQKGERTHYKYAFSYYGWNSENFRPKYDIILSGTSANYLFQYTTNLEIDLAQRMQALGIKFVYNNFTNAAYMFQYSAITRIGELDFSNCTETYQAFGSATKLTTIDKLIVSEKTIFNTPFAGCSLLENLRFEGVIGGSLNIKSSPLLSGESVQSAIDHLKDLTGQTTQNLTLHATVGGKLTEEQKAAITAKNWTLVY